MAQERLTTFAEELDRVTLAHDSTGGGFDALGNDKGRASAASDDHSGLLISCV